MMMSKLPDGMVFTYALDRKGVALGIQQKELVMCRNCKYWWSPEATAHQTPGCKWRGDEVPSPTDFCSYGKKR